VLFLFTPTMKMEQSVPKRRHITLRRWRITQWKEYNIDNTAKVWNQESRILFFVCLFCLLVLTLLFKRATFYCSAQHSAVHKTMHTVSFANATTFGSSNTCLLQTVSLIQKCNASYCSYVFKMFSDSLQTM